MIGDVKTRILSHRLAFLGLLVAVSIVWFRLDILALAEVSLGHEQYSHILLILPLSACLAFMEAKQSIGAGKSAPKAGLALLAPAALLSWIGGGGAIPLSESTRLSVNILALVLSWFAFVLLLFGTEVFRRFQWPLLVLLLLVPLPEWVLSRLVFAFQVASAKTTFWLFRLAGIPVTQNGLVLSLPVLDVEVAQQCSGIRSTMMLLVTCLTLCYLFLKPGWRRILLVILVLPISVLKNGVRIFVLATLGMYVDEAWLNGRLHHQGGIVFFVLGTAMLGFAIWVLRRFDSGRCKQSGIWCLSRDTR
jgi:exosortase